jgi:hypothetical protein
VLVLSLHRLTSSSSVRQRDMLPAVAGGCRGSDRGRAGTTAARCGPPRGRDGRGSVDRDTQVGARQAAGARRLDQPGQLDDLFAGDGVKQVLAADQIRQPAGAALVDPEARPEGHAARPRAGRRAGGSERERLSAWELLPVHDTVRMAEIAGAPCVTA